MSPSLFEVSLNCLSELAKNWMAITDFFSVTGDTMAGDVACGFCYDTNRAKESFIFTLETGSVAGGRPFKQLRFYKRVEQVEEMPEIVYPDEEIIELRAAIARDSGRKHVRFDENNYDGVEENSKERKQIEKSGGNDDECSVVFEKESDDDVGDGDEDIVFNDGGDDDGDEIILSPLRSRKRKKGEKMSSAAGSSDVGVGKNKKKTGEIVERNRKLASLRRNDEIQNVNFKSKFNKTLLFQMSAQAVIRLNEHIERICVAFGVSPPIVRSVAAVDANGNGSGGGGRVDKRLKKGTLLAPHEI